MCWDSATSGLDGRHIYFRYNTTSGDIVDNTVEQLDLENMGIDVVMLSVGVLELKITLGWIFTPSLPQCVCKRRLAIRRLTC